ESFEQVRRGQALGAGAPERRRSMIAATVTAASLGILAALLMYAVALSSLVTEARYARVANSALGSSARYLVAMRMTPYRAPIDSSITPERAGEALHAISTFGRELGPFERPPARALRGTWVWVEEPTEFAHSAKVAWQDNAILSARRGLTPAQRKLLQT